MFPPRQSPCGSTSDIFLSFLGRKLVYCPKQFIKLCKMHAAQLKLKLNHKSFRPMNSNSEILVKCSRENYCGKTLFRRYLRTSIKEKFLRQIILRRLVNNSFIKHISTPWVRFWDKQVSLFPAITPTSSGFLGWAWSRRVAF